MRKSPDRIDTETLAYDVNDAMRVLSIGRNKLYDEITAGRLDARKVGRRTVIPRAAIEAWLSNLPRVASTAA
ncbi:excisionase family DNA binding protein [Ancylobacter aquaticus]|uniref:Excisionase family DNA binding protein n=1 Tax=Ancylobacter aquaticus TaxID=100 RepID=A0A4R1I4C9_ANCAQ|nr:helix-turn-helix domain-containing protein [Ancylobacter aquaticus]TCK30147.1 excisionase family DNA binding protein [Ancylobacter aquaticus]